MSPRKTRTGRKVYDEFMVQAYVMENDARDRYTEFADQMEVHNNLEVAAMFRTMANYESKHADEIMAMMGWSEAPPVTRRDGAWPGYEGPETTAGDEVHYLMQPFHALQLALAAEEGAVDTAHERDADGAEGVEVQRRALRRPD